MPNCKKCLMPFKTWQIIDGVGKNLGNRKYCLVCSPYNKHNTSRLHLAKENCIVCEVKLINSQIKFCSDPCKAKWHYKNYMDRPNSTYAQYVRGFVRKLALIKLAGGGCIRCGYADNMANLHFHHTRDKSFSLDSRNLANSKWENIIEESKKCILLCSKCHNEEHYPDLTISKLMELYGDEVEKFLTDVNNNKFPNITYK